MITDQFSRCDLSRPCQTCRDRDHPELCSYHPPNKRQNADQAAPQVPMPRSEDGYAISGAPPAGPGNVTLSQAQFDMLCNKLHGLENSIAELRNEIARNSNGQSISEIADTAMYSRGDDVQANGIDSQCGQVANGDGKAPQLFQRHAAMHGIHAKNDQVCLLSSSIFSLQDLPMTKTVSGPSRTFRRWLNTSFSHRYAKRR